MAKSIKQACANKNDELYTPKILVDAIKDELVELYTRLKKKIGREPIIWLPFDLERSEFAYLCKKLNYKYVCSHISNKKKGGGLFQIWTFSMRYCII